MPDTINVEIRLFARLRELCGDQGRVDVEVPAGATAQQCFDRLGERCDKVTPLRQSLAVAVNDEYATWDRELCDGDVVAFIPPVSGGGAAIPGSARRSPRGSRPAGDARRAS